jgi:hypothetical protein
MLSVNSDSERISHGASMMPTTAIITSFRGKGQRVFLHRGDRLQNAGNQTHHQQRTEER